MTDHAALIAKLRAATKPSADLDADIVEAVGWAHGMRREGAMFWREYEGWAPREGMLAPPYLSSLDAALGTARNLHEQWRIIRALDWFVDAWADDAGAPVVPMFALCRAALLVRLGGDSEPQLGRGWKISEQTKREIDEIEKSIRR
jgi:hypothetical protein